MPAFLPALRRGVEVKALQQTQVPVAFAAYYNDLLTYNVHNRAGGNWSVERAIAEGFERVVWVFRSTNTIASDHARLPFGLRDGDEELDDHPLMRLLNKRANPLETGKVFRKRLSAQITLSPKGAFVERTKSNGGTPKRLDLLPPDRTEIIPSSDGGIEWYMLRRRNGSVRYIEPDKVLWFRDPHPLDPYAASTPLEAAGMSVELDHMARLYNVAFLRNDGRPGGVLAVRKTDNSSGDIAPEQMDRIEAKFGKGPTRAGELSVIAGDLSYVDLAAKPRDMQYGQMSRNSKIEILSAFGVPESVLGYAADRTFDNADNELYVYLTRTLANHNDIIVSGFDEDSDDSLEGYLDVSGIEVLERHERAKREEARTEVAAGLRSIYSYAQMAGYAEEIDETPQTRALYVPQGKTPLPARKADYVALGLPDPDAPAVVPGAPADGGDGAAPGGDATAPEAAPGADVAPAALPPTGEPAAAPQTPPAAAMPPAETGLDMAAFTGKHLVALEGGQRYRTRMQRKAADADPGNTGQWVESTHDPAQVRGVEQQVEAALTALAERWVERTIARIGSPKQRKGTRHWTPQYEQDTRLGTKALDAAKAVDEQTWQTEAEQAVSPILTAAAVAAAAALLADLAITPPPGSTITDLARRSVEGTVDTVVRFVGAAAARAAQTLIAAVNTSDQNGTDLETILEQTRSSLGGLRTWAARVAVQATTATVNGSREDAATETTTLPEQPSPGERDVLPTPQISEITRSWRSRRDDKVRHTHGPAGGADGQVRELHEPFIVGDSLLRYPGDPLAPLAETANCRCWLTYRARRSGRFAGKPEGADALAAAGL